MRFAGRVEWREKDLHFVIRQRLQVQLRFHFYLIDTPKYRSQYENLTLRLKIGASC
jgi:hypothetical protein